MQSHSLDEEKYTEREFSELSCDFLEVYYPEYFWLGIEFKKVGFDKEPNHQDVITRELLYSQTWEIEKKWAKGVEITKVFYSSAAYDDWLMQWDIITHIDWKEITQNTSVAEIRWMLRWDIKTELTIRIKGKDITTLRSKFTAVVSPNSLENYLSDKERLIDFVWNSVFDGAGSYISKNYPYHENLFFCKVVGDSQRVLFFYEYYGQILWANMIEFNPEGDVKKIYTDIPRFSFKYSLWVPKYINKDSVIYGGRLFYYNFYE